MDCEGVRLGGVQFSSLLLRRGEVEQGVEVVTLFDSLVAVRQGLTLNSSLTLLSLQGGRNLTYVTPTTTPTFICIYSN